MIKRKWQRGDRIELRFPMKPRVSRWYRNSIAVERGPIVYSLELGPVWKKLKDRGPASDWEADPSRPWNYALAVDVERPEVVGRHPSGPVGATGEPDLKPAGAVRVGHLRQDDVDLVEPVLGDVMQAADVARAALGAVVDRSRVGRVGPVGGGPLVGDPLDPGGQPAGLVAEQALHGLRQARHDDELHPQLFPQVQQGGASCR